jgi:tRNA (cmo5U34)-methyltransferase
MPAVAIAKLIYITGISKRIILIQGYVQDLATDTAYATATSILVMYLIPNETSKLAFLQSIAQHLKPSAPIILVDIFGTKESSELEKTLTTLHAY